MSNQTNRTSLEFDARPSDNICGTARNDDDRYRSIIESAVDFAFIVIDRERRVTEWSPGAERILGWEARDMLGESADRIFTPDDISAGQPALEQQRSDKEGRALDERWHMRKDGSRFWAAGEMMPLKKGASERAGYVKILRDRTREHLAGLALVRAEAMQSAIVLLNDRIRDLTDPADIGAVCCELLGNSLEVDLVAYGDVDPASESVTFASSWSASSEPIAPSMSLKDWGRFGEAIKRNGTVVIRDVDTGLTAEARASFLPLGNARSFVHFPVFERGRLVAVMSVCRDRPHNWSDEDVTFIGDVAGRIRLGMMRARSELALRESEARFRTALEIETVGALYFDREGHIVDANDGFLRMSGHDREDIAAGRLSWQALTPPEWIEPSEHAFAELLSLGQTTPYVKEYFRKDGSRWTGLFAAKVLPGEVYFEFVIDITERKNAEDALHRLNSELEQRVEERTLDRNQLWQLSSDIMLRCGFDGRIVAVNPAWTAVLGWREEELVGFSLSDLIHPDDVGRTAEGARELSQGVGHARFDNRYRHKDGSYRWISWSTSSGGGLINAVGRDFTSEKEQAETLARTEEQLRQSQKMEAVGQLTGGLAHDFNNLLAGISGSLELLGTRVAQGRINDLQRYTTAAQGATKRAAALTHRLLAFSRRQTLDPKPTDANALIRDMEELIRRTVGPEISLETDLCSDLWPTLVDPSQLENALLNLAINARDAMPDGGSLRIQTENHAMEAAAAAGHDAKPGDYVLLTVTDTGTGMAPDVVRKAFDPFFTTKPLGAGTGLGLSMIHGFAHQSGGQIRIHSELGSGTSMCLYLPRHAVAAKQVEDDRCLGDAPRAEDGQTVLVVDDEPLVRMIVTDVLEELGYAAIEAADGKSGLKVLESNVRIDLLVTDVGLPGGMNGRQMADAARVSRPDLKVLFVTGYAESTVVGSGNLEAGMHVMTKPFAMEALAARIKELITAR